MPKRATCVQPKPEISEEISVETTEKEIWFSNIPEGGFKFTYKADSNQVSQLSFTFVLSRFHFQQKTR